MKHRIIVTSNFKLGGEVWSLSDPSDYTVEKSEPIRKSSGGGMFHFLTADNLQILVLLQQTGFFEWAKSQSFDYLWDYLKEVVMKIPDKIMPGQSATITIKDADGNTRMEVGIPNFDPAMIEEGGVT